MKLSVVISVYQSHEAVRRQLLHLKRMDLPIEIIIVDDGSDPPIEGASYQTGNKLAWTQGLGRNLGASKAGGEYLLFTDIDHILSRGAIEDVLNFNGAMMRFPRYFGILDENGNLKTDRKSLEEYGLAEGYLNRKEMRVQSHLNTFAVPKKLFDSWGGYAESWCNYGYHPKSYKGDDCYLNGQWKRYAKENHLEQVMGSKIYVFPNGRFHKEGDLNPFGLFHNLSHKQEKFYKG